LWNDCSHHPTFQEHPRTVFPVAGVIAGDGNSTSKRRADCKLELCEGCAIVITNMNTAIVKTAPEGDFENISIEIGDWKIGLQSLIDQRKGIKYRTTHIPTLSTDFKEALNKQNYIDLVLETDHAQHFLVPA
jgi:hypothetical protein